MNDKYSATIVFTPAGAGADEYEGLKSACVRYGFELDGLSAMKVGDEMKPISDFGNNLIREATEWKYRVIDIKITAPDGIKAPMPKITGTAIVIGPTQTLLNTGNTPAANALDSIASGRHDIMTTTEGTWTPALCFDRAQTLIDAEARLGTGGDMEGVARQVAGLMLIALERLELEKAAT